ncbi:MAG: WG repeat-containing protein [Bacteroidetes bacterium]|nr:WG repeat-containing protein [Bacteroidota bacterium]
MTKNLLTNFAAFVALCFLNSCSHNSSNDRFSYLLIPVQSDEKWGYIDKQGKYVVNPQFKSAYLITDGIAVVESSEGKFGYIGEDGKYIINPIYKFASNFSEGLAFVASENGFPTCINKKGETQFVLKDASLVGVFNDGLAYIQVKEKYGFIDNTGKTVINPQFDVSNQFSDGLAAVANKKDKDADKVWGYIDKLGKIIINPQFKTAGDFKDGKALVGDGKKFGYIDKKGLYIINPQFDEASIFSEGLAGIKQGETWGFINTEGKIVINPQFEAISSFKNGLAAVRSGKENWGYIDKEGKFAINPQFKAAGEFFGDYAPVVSGDKIGLIDKQGKYVVNPQFSDIFSNYMSWNNSFIQWTPYEAIRSDYFDVTEITSKLFEDSKDGKFRGLNRQSSVKDLIDNPDYKESLKENTKYSAVCFTKKEITEDVSIEKTTFYTHTAIYDYVQQYYYGYSMGSEKKYNLAAMLESVEYKLTLSNWGKAKNKGKTLAEGIKTELLTLYNGTAKDVSNADASTRYLDSLATASSIGSSTDEGTLFVYASKISFSINYTESSVTLTAKFKEEPNM